MSKCKNTWAISALMASIALVSCGGGGSNGAEDETEIDPPENDTNFLVPEADVLPLTSADGAEEGFAGCLNRPLYFNGPHFVSTTSSSSTTLYEDTFNSSENKDLAYTVIEIKSDGIALVDFETTTSLSNGNGSTGSYPVTLAGNYLYSAGEDTDDSGDDALLLNYDLKLDEPVTLTKTLASGIEQVEVYSYGGREEITIAGQQADACRYEVLITQPMSDPQFRTTSHLVRWYGVGTGLTLREDWVALPDSQDVSTTLTILNSAVINGITIY